MAFFKQNPARHRAETPSHMVRNTTIAAAAGAAMLGSVAPAQAYAEIPAASETVHSAPTASPANYSWYTDTAPVAHQAVSYQAPVSQPAVAPQAAATVTPQAITASLSTQSTDITPIAGASGIVATALSAEGTGYVWGGTAYGAWDCSGFTQWVYAQNGIDIPRTTWSQFAAATPTANPQPGDLVSQNGGNHVGIYLGGGKMISALNPSQGTVVHSVNAMPVDGYYTFR